MMSQEPDQVTKAQHFVPRFYLRKFLNTENEVEVLDCQTRSIMKPRGVRGICYEHFFYGMKTGQPDDVSQHIEQYFKLVEDHISRRLDAIISKLLNNEQIHNEDKWLIAFLMSMLWIRGPKMRSQINLMQEQASKHAAAFHFSNPNIDQWFDKVDKEMGRTTSREMRETIKKGMQDGSYALEFDNSQHLLMLENVPGFANMFWGQDWVVYISRSHSKFVTSDNPVAMFIPERQGFYGPGFFERTHYFALTPDIYIEARYPNNRTGKKLRRKTLFHGSEKIILRLNMNIAWRAYQYVYATERKSVQELRDVLLQAVSAQQSKPGQPVQV